MAQQTHRITLADMERTFTGQEVVNLMESLIESAQDVVWSFADEYRGDGKHRESGKKLSDEEIQNFAEGEGFFAGSRSLASILETHMWDAFGSAVNDPELRL